MLLRCFLFLLFNSFHLDHSEDHQRSFNGIRVSSSAYDVHRGDDFYKKLMFYEKNSSTPQEINPNPFPTSTNSSRRSSFHQSSTNPSTTTTPATTAKTRPIPTTTQLISSRMSRSKSYKDLFDPPSSTASITHPVYYQQTPPPAPSLLSDNPSTGYYSSSYQNPHPPSSTIVANMLGNASALVDYSRRTINNSNIIQDDISSSSTGHLPKPPPGIPSQNAR